MKCYIIGNMKERERKGKRYGLKKRERERIRKIVRESQREI